MKNLTATSGLPALIGLTTLAVVLWLAPVAQARTYPDVPKSSWAYAAINWVTNQGPAGAKLLDDYAGTKFAPTQPLTREQLAAALVTALGDENEAIADPVDVTDVPASDPYYHAVQVALTLRFFSLSKGSFYPTAGVAECQADHALVRTIELLHPKADWSMLRTLSPSRWQPNPGWTTGAPARLPWEVAARFLGLRYNHFSDPALELSPGQDIDRAEAAYMFRAALTVPSWQLQKLSWFDQVTLPSLSARQRQIVSFALQYVGYPYVWGGTWPTVDSPFGLQAHGGFDCSGFVWWVLKLNFGYPIADTQRTAAQMAAAAKPRIPLSKLQPCDIIFFGPKGPKSTAASIFHTALYLGNGWFIESSNYFDGVTLANLDWPGWYYRSAFAWGRRVLTTAQLQASPTS
jgi:hypothetical protein